ncbi:hypothetical protein Tco_0808156, partial [Tanacetum coccineum]
IVPGGSDHVDGGL